MSRLLQLQSENDQAGAEMLIENERFSRIGGISPRPVSSFNLFQTPISIAEKMVSFVPNTYKEPFILEPSAGLGRLYDAIYTKYQSAAHYTLVENSSGCMKELYAKDQGAILIQRDFFKVSPEKTGLMDVIIMNPPFKNGIDIKHVTHALTFLNKCGTLISLCANGPRQNKRLRPLADHWEVLPENSFKETGTKVSVALLVITQK